MPQFGASLMVVTDDTSKGFYSTGITYNRHLQVSKYYYSTSHRYYVQSTCVSL